MATKKFLAKLGLDNNSQTITNVADPVNAQDAATRAYVLANAGGGGGGSSTLTISNKTAAYTVVAGDNGTILNWTSGTFTATLTAAATLGAGFNVWIWNTGTGVVTIDTNLTETIDGIDPVLLFKLTQGSGIRLVCNGTGWYSTDVRMSGSAAVGVGAVQLGRNSTGLNSIATAQGAVVLGGSYASGDDSFATNISNNTNTYGAQGANSIAIGRMSKAAGNGSVCIGSNSDSGTASGTQSICLGSTFSTASGFGSVAIGAGAKSVLTFKYVFGGGSLYNANAGECQSSIMHLVGLTTDATPKKLTSQSNATATAINQLILPNNSAINFRIQVIALQKAANGTGVAGYTFTGVIRRGADEASTALLASAKTVDYESVVGWDCDVTADTTNGGLSVTATGAATTNIRWVATCWSSEANAYA